MAMFMVRVELHGVSHDSETYKDLHGAMELVGFSRTITVDNNRFYHLLSAEYPPTSDMIENLAVALGYLLTNAPEKVSEDTLKHMIILLSDHFNTLFIRKPVLHLSIALAAAIIYAEAGSRLGKEKEHGSTATAIVRECCSRGVRSFHVPVILGPKADYNINTLAELFVLAGPQNIYRRMERLVTHVKSGVVTPELFDEILAFSRQIRYRDERVKKDLAIFSAALLASAGFEPDVNALGSQHPLCGELKGFFNVFIQHSPDLILLKEHIDELKAMFRESIDFPFLLLDNIFQD